MRSISENGTESNGAKALPTVDLPLHMKPMSTMCLRSQPEVVVGVRWSIIGGKIAPSRVSYGTDRRYRPEDRT